MIFKNLWNKIFFLNSKNIFKWKRNFNLCKFKSMKIRLLYFYSRLQSKYKYFYMIFSYDSPQRRATLLKVRVESIKICLLFCIRISLKIPAKSSAQKKKYAGMLRLCCRSRQNNTETNYIRCRIVLDLQILKKLEYSLSNNMKWFYELNISMTHLKGIRLEVVEI